MRCVKVEVSTAVKFFYHFYQKNVYCLLFFVMFYMLYKAHIYVTPEIASINQPVSQSINQSINQFQFFYFRVQSMTITKQRVSKYLGILGAAVLMIYMFVEVHRMGLVVRMNQIQTSRGPDVETDTTSSKLTVCI